LQNLHQLFVLCTLAIIVKCRDAEIKIFQECPRLLFFLYKNLSPSCFRSTASDVTVTVKTILKQRSHLYLGWQTVRLSDVVTDRTFGSTKLFDRTSTVRFGPNDKTFFCRTQNFFLYYIQCQWHPFLLNDPH
jgi:hypothetical protein